MNRGITFVAAGVAAITCSFAFAQSQSSNQKDAKKPAGQETQLPPGMTEADMQACMEASIPGEMHARLAKDIGVWQGKNKMWMGPGTEPVMSESKTTVSPMMEGRYVKVETAGDIPGMGPFNGFGIYGFDNVSQTFQASWIDNCGTGIMNGTGELSSDGNTLTWKYSYNCPITKKPTMLREVQKQTGKNSKLIEMYAIDPNTGKEFKMMEIASTRISENTPISHAR